MLNDLIKGVVKLAVLLALVKFVVLPMLPSNLNFGGGFPSPADILKDPIKFGKDALAALDPRKVVENALKPPAPPSVTVQAPDLGQVGRDAEQARQHAQHTLEQKGQEVLNSVPKPPMHF